MHLPPSVCDHCVFNSRSALDELSDLPAIILDSQGSVIWASPRWASHWKGKTPCGLRWLEFVHAEDLPVVVRWIRDRKDGRVRFRLLRPGECDPDWISVSAARQPLNTGCSLVLANLDASHQ